MKFEALVLLALAFETAILQNIYKQCESGLENSKPFAYTRHFRVRLIYGNDEDESYVSSLCQVDKLMWIQNQATYFIGYLQLSNSVEYTLLGKSDSKGAINWL